MCCAGTFWILEIAMIHRDGEIGVRYKQKGRQEGCKEGVLLLV